MTNLNVSSNNIQDFGFLLKVKAYAKNLFSSGGLFDGMTSIPKTSETSKEIPIMHDITDEQICAENKKNKYIKIINHKNYTVKVGDNPSKIANKFGVECASILLVNGLNNNSKLNVGDILKIPSTRIPNNIKNVQNLADALGVSRDFILKLKRIEDGTTKSDSQFHNDVYDDATGGKSDGIHVKGSETIGIGHLWKKGEQRYLSNEQVLTLCAKDMLKSEENLKALIGSEKVYARLPNPIKEALLDMTFNKGTDIIKNSEGLLWCIKNGKYEAAINKMTNNKSAKTGKELSGLSKRRLFDISTAIKMYNGKIPNSVINTAQKVYNRGIELLRREFPQKSNFKAQLIGYNKDVVTYFGNKLKLANE